MATKGKNKNSIRRRVRTATKDVTRDLGSKGSARMIQSGYKRGVSPKDFPRAETGAEDYDYHGPEFKVLIYFD